MVSKIELLLFSKLAAFCLHFIKSEFLLGVALI